MVEIFYAQAYKVAAHNRALLGVRLRRGVQEAFAAHLSLVAAHFARHRVFPSRIGSEVWVCNKLLTKYEVPIV